MNHCNEFFRPGLLTTIMDIGAGSSGKGKIGSYVMANQDVATFAVCTFHPQAGHWVVLDDGRRFFYQSLNSCAYLLGDRNRQIAAAAKEVISGTLSGAEQLLKETGKITSLEKLYIAPGAMIELPALLREIKENGLKPHQLGISPIVPILDPEIDGAFEQGRTAFDTPVSTDEHLTAGMNGGHAGVRHDGTAKFGSTAHGVGSCTARRVLRRPSLKLARDISELQQYLCDVPAEIMERLDRGESGLLEVAQGFQLSMMLSDFYPYTTSRNVTVQQGLTDCMLPTRYAGPVIGNIRTFGIRINSNKYIGRDDGRHLTWAEVQAGVPHEVYEGSSGHWYPDQAELTWEMLTHMAGSETPIMEITSVTKLPRRVATFSRENVKQWLRYNDTGHGMYLSLNFCNYVDAKLLGARDPKALLESEQFMQWATTYMHDLPPVRFFGTGAETESTIFSE